MKQQILVHKIYGEHFWKWVEPSLVRQFILIHKHIDDVDISLTDDVDISLMYFIIIVQ